VSEDAIPLGPVPAGESPARAGDSDYAARAFVECRHYIALLQRVLGPEPAGARLRVRRSGPDFDPYLDVVVEYDTANAVARAYAIRCDREAPIKWEERPVTPSRS
jgi:hypothetical protein